MSVLFLCRFRCFFYRLFNLLFFLCLFLLKEAGAFNKQTGNNAAGGIGAKLSPAAVLVISNGKTRLVNIKNQDAISKIIDMAPEIVDRITGFFKKEKTEEEEQIEQAVEEASKPAEE